MRKLFTILTAVLFTASVFAQSPEKMSYQAVIRNSSNHLVTSQSVGMQISILQGSASGTAVYVETQTPTTNANGLVSLEIGSGTLVSGTFASINWANGPYFIKTETDPAGGTSYSITGTNQLLSVPYALHAKTAESITGTITETDPTYTSSQAANITTTDITNLGNLSGVNTGDQDLSTLATKTALSDSTAQVRSEIPAAADGSETKVAAGTNVTITGAGTTASPYVINATGGGSLNDFYLGQDTLGGIVFYIYIGSDGNQHGLIVSKTETTAKWQNTGVTTNATRSWDGVYNMNLMSGSPAKDWVTGSFSTDWYLPSIDELSILWHNRFHANKGLNDAGATLLSNSAYYWSSTEFSATNAFTFYFLSGATYGSNKTNTYSVRAVRAF